MKSERPVETRARGRTAKAAVRRTSRREKKVRAPSRRTCANCGRAFWPKPNNPTKQEYCSEACYSVYRRACLRDPLYAALTGARAKLGKRELAPEVIRTLATYLAMEPDLAQPPTPRKRVSRHLKRKPEPPRPSPPDKLLPWPRLGDDGFTPLGVTFKVPGQTREDVRRLLLSYGFSVPGMTDEDFCQVVCLTIFRRNNMESAFDPRRGSFSHYVNVLARGVMLNLRQAAKRNPELTEEGDLPEELNADQADDALDGFDDLPADIRHHAAALRRYANG